MTPGRCLECDRSLTATEAERPREECDPCVNRRNWEDFCKSKSDPYDHAHGYDRGGEE